MRMNIHPISHPKNAGTRGVPFMFIPYREMNSEHGKTTTHGMLFSEHQMNRMNTVEQVGRREPVYNGVTESFTGITHCSGRTANRLEAPRTGGMAGPLPHVKGLCGDPVRDSRTSVIVESYSVTLFSLEGGNSHENHHRR